MTNEQKNQIFTLLRKAQTEYAKQTRDYERGYLEGAIVGIEKACEVLGYIVKYNPLNDEWTIEER